METTARIFKNGIHIVDVLLILLSTFSSLAQEDQEEIARQARETFLARQQENWENFFRHTRSLTEAALEIVKEGNKKDKLNAN